MAVNTEPTNRDRADRMTSAVEEYHLRHWNYQPLDTENDRKSIITDMIADLCHYALLEHDVLMEEEDIVHAFRVFREELEEAQSG